MVGSKDREGSQHSVRAVEHTGAGTERLTQVGSLSAVTVFSFFRLHQEKQNHYLFCD